MLYYVGIACRSMSDLEERGYLDDSRDNNDPYLEGEPPECCSALPRVMPVASPATACRHADIMRSVNKVQYEELSEEQIAAARKRRAR